MERMCSNGPAHLQATGTAMLPVFDLMVLDPYVSMDCTKVAHVHTPASLVLVECLQRDRLRSLTV